MVASVWWGHGDLERDRSYKKDILILVNPHLLPTPSLPRTYPSGPTVIPVQQWPLVYGQPPTEIMRSNWIKISHGSIILCCPTPGKMHNKWSSSLFPCIVYICYLKPQSLLHLLRFYDHCNPDRPTSSCATCLDRHVRHAESREAGHVLKSQQI